MSCPTVGDSPIENNGKNWRLSNPFLTSLLKSCRAGDPTETADALRAWLTPDERAALAGAALTSLDDTDAEMVAAATLASLRAGPPSAPFGGVMAAAWEWGTLASPAEIRAFAWVAFHQMPLASRQRFLARIFIEREAAA